MTAEKDNVSLVYKIEHEADMTFPIEGYKGQSRYGVYRYVPLVESAGVALVALLPSAEEKANIVIRVGTACFPMLFLTLLMVLLAGAVLWALESGANPEEFPNLFTRGLWAGFWWAYITCTTLGYGDKVPCSFLGRLFAIVWTLVGLVIMSFLVAEMTSALVSYSVLQTANKKISGVKIGAIQASPEYTLGVRKTARMNPGQQYHTYREINRALMNKEVEGALIDLNVVSTHKDLSSNPNLRVFKVFDYQKTYGVVLAEVSMKLEKCFLDFVELNKADIFHKMEESVKRPMTYDDSISKDPVQEVGGGLFDPSAYQFRLSVFFLLALFAVVAFCGLVYHIHRALKRRSNSIELYNHLATIRREMRQEVDNFYRRFSENVEELRRRHIKERRRFLARRSSSFFQITMTSFRKFSEN